ncbi:hypothetical protein DFH09DRAFT_1102263 [Mycena vulgaris]|nr:hypothetical protein DFH09DRAFT_1102263 [Mycena vulgaris]
MGKKAYSGSGSSAVTGSESLVPAETACRLRRASKQGIRNVKLIWRLIFVGGRTWDPWETWRMYITAKSQQMGIIEELEGRTGCSSSECARDLDLLEVEVEWCRRENIEKIVVPKCEMRCMKSKRREYAGGRGEVRIGFKGMRFRREERSRTGGGGSREFINITEWKG